MRKSAETNLPRMPIRASGPGSRAAKHIVALLSLVLFTASHDKAAHGGAGAQLDEVLAQLVYLDADGNPAFGQPPITLYTLRDANFNVVALADEYGRLAAQYTYDPYGKVRSAELMANPATGPPNWAVNAIDSNATTNTYWNRVLAAARSNRLGFQGLPAERLDVDGPWLDPLGSDGLTFWGGGTNTDILGGVPPASHEVVYHARNRVFSPRHQRFISVDPNGVGVPILDDLSFGGMAIGPSSIDPDYLSYFGDGMNAHAAFGGNPLTRSDPSGLFWNDWSDWWDDLQEGAGVAGNAAHTLLAHSDIHGLIQSQAEELIEQYAANLEDDVAWATDWSRSDDDYSRLDSRWVALAFARGAVRHFNYDYWTDSSNDGPAMANSASGLVGRVIRGTAKQNKLMSRFFRRFNTVKLNLDGIHFALDRKSIKHILERHHPKVWNGSIKKSQSFFDHRMDFDEVVAAIKDVASQNSRQLKQIGLRRGQVIGNYGGRNYVLGVQNGRIGQFYPR